MFSQSGHRKFLATVFIISCLIALVWMTRISIALQ